MDRDCSAIISMFIRRDVKRRTCSLAFEKFSNFNLGDSYQGPWYKALEMLSGFSAVRVRFEYLVWCFPGASDEGDKPCTLIADFSDHGDSVREALRFMIDGNC